MYWLFVTDRYLIQCAYECNVETLSRNYYCRAKAASVTYSECMSVALGIQHAKRMSLVVFSSVALWLCHILPHYLINGTIFGGKKSG